MLDIHLPEALDVIDECSRQIRAALADENEGEVTRLVLEMNAIVETAAFLVRNW